MVVRSLKQKGEEKKELSERINVLIETKAYDTYRVRVRFQGIDWRFMTATQMRKCVKLLEEL